MFYRTVIGNRHRSLRKYNCAVRMTSASASFNVPPATPESIRSKVEYLNSSHTITYYRRSIVEIQQVRRSLTQSKKNSIAFSSYRRQSADGSEETFAVQTISSGRPFRCRDHVEGWNCYRTLPKSLRYICAFSKSRVASSREIYEIRTWKANSIVASHLMKYNWAVLFNQMMSIS